MADTEFDLVTRALPEIVYSGGLKELNTVSKINIDDDDGDLKAVPTMNRANEAIGYTDGVATHTFNLEIALERGTPEVDWFALKRSKERFLFSYEEVGAGEADENNEGNRFQFVKCRVKKVAKSFSESGAPTLSVDCVALGHRPVPA